MDKKLPKVFANNIGNIKNNEVIYYSKNKSKVEEKNINKHDIYKKINQIFSSSRYVYKALVKITTVNGIFDKKIIGRNKNSLITLDNEIINIEDIIDIEF